jgi:hypothetical protein
MNITPETDAMVESSFYSINFPTNPIPAEFARRLERERDAWKAKFIQQNKDLGCELIDPNGTILDYAKKLQKDLDAAIAERDNAITDWRQADTDSIRAFRERNEAREKLSEWSILNAWGGTPEIIHDFIKGQQTRIHHAQNVEDELATAIAESDALIKALAYWRDISECDCNDPIPNGGCLRCDLDKVFNSTNQND